MQSQPCPCDKDVTSMQWRCIYGSNGGGWLSVLGWAKTLLSPLHTTVCVETVVVACFNFARFRVTMLCARDVCKGSMLSKPLSPLLIWMYDLSQNPSHRYLWGYVFLRAYDLRICVKFVENVLACKGAKLPSAWELCKFHVLCPNLQVTLGVYVNLVRV